MQVEKVEILKNLKETNTTEKPTTIQEFVKICILEFQGYTKIVGNILDDLEKQERQKSSKIVKLSCELIYDASKEGNISPILYTMQKEKQKYDKWLNSPQKRDLKQIEKNWQQGGFQLMCALFLWHFTKYKVAYSLGKKELEYINVCWNTFPSDYLRLTKADYFGELPYLNSFFSYSHKFKPSSKNINSNRVYFGSPGVGGEFLLPYAKAMLESSSDILKKFDSVQNRGVIDFGGCGWDFSTKCFKIYFSFEDRTDEKTQAIILKVLKLLKEDTLKTYSKNSKHYLPNGLYSFTMQKKNDKLKLVEEKLYFYPKAADKSILDTVDMYSSVSGFNIQVDLLGCEFDKKKVNKKGADIIQTYEAIGMTLETINCEGKNDYSLYFPRMYTILEANKQNF